MVERKEDDKGTETTGHSWDGIEEFNTPLPRWWLWTFYITIVWAVGYAVMYPSWPFLTKAWPGIERDGETWSSRGDLDKAVAAHNAKNGALDARIVSLEVADIAGDAEVGDYAKSGGAAVFRTFCIQCHGSGAQGAFGYPNLLDDDWLWGGDIDAIYTTVKHGIRADYDDDTRLNDMPAFGDDWLTDEQISDVAEYALSLSGNSTASAETLAAGELVFVEEAGCGGCHGEDGTGLADVGGPNLTDAIWLYGSDLASVIEMVKAPRGGEMPAWSFEDRLTESQIRQVAVYVHELGGGE